MLQVHLHKDKLKDLHKKLSPDILPEELGGKLGPADVMAEVSGVKLEVKIDMSQTWRG